MLERLALDNYLLFDTLDLPLHPGLTVVTGESGAGKSMLLSALQLILGGKVNWQQRPKIKVPSRLIAVFNVPAKHPARQVLADKGLDVAADEPLIIRRMLLPQQKSTAYINDTLVSQGLLSAVGAELVEIVGQFASQQALNPHKLLLYVDDYGQLADQRKAVGATYKTWQQAQQQLADVADALERAEKEFAFSQYAAEELGKLDVQPDEETQLIGEKQQLLAAQKAAKQAGQVMDFVSRGLAQECYNQAAKIADDPALADAANQLEIAAQAFDTAEDHLHKAIPGLAVHDQAIEAVDDRLYTLRDMARKYRTSVDGLPDLAAHYSQQVQATQQLEQDKAAAAAQAHDTQMAYDKAAQTLTAARQKIAQKLSKTLQGLLPDVGLPLAKIHIALVPQDPHDYGQELPCVRWQPNPGLPEEDGHHVASGGELARLLLIMHNALATSRPQTVLVFDEIDQGVSGKAASALGRKLTQLGDQGQVLAITHSPQVAAHGQQHLLVRKARQDTKTVSTIEAASAEDRASILASMLSGQDITGKATAAAEQLLQEAAA